MKLQAFLKDKLRTINNLKLVKIAKQGNLSEVSNVKNRIIQKFEILKFFKAYLEFRVLT